MQMQEIIKAEQDPNDSESCPKSWRRKNNKWKHETLSDSDDEAYTSSETSDLESGGDDDTATIIAEEVRF
jgi:hypothetical protein